MRSGRLMRRRLVSAIPNQLMAARKHVIVTALRILLLCAISMTAVSPALSQSDPSAGSADDVQLVNYIQTIRRTGLVQDAVRQYGKPVGPKSENFIQLAIAN